MSNPVSALGGKSHAGQVAVRDLGLRGMITLRGDLSNAKLRKVSAAVSGVRFPEQGKAAIEGASGLAWMSPDELLIMVPYDDVSGALEKINKALKGQHFLAINVSDARAVMSLSGPFVREVLAKLAPVDLHPDSFAIGDFRRTRLGQVAAAFCLTDAQTAQIICFRSVAGYAFDLLAASADEGPVGHFPNPSVGG